MAAIQKKKQNKSYGLLLDEQMVLQARTLAKQNYNVSFSSLVRILIEDFLASEAAILKECECDDE